MKRLLLTILLAIAAPAFAQTGAPAAENVRIRFSVVGWGESFEDIAYRQGGSLQKLGSVPLFARSETFEYHGPPALAFFRLPAAEDGEPERRSAPVATAAIPRGLTRAMVLLSKQQERYQLLVVPDDVDVIPPGRALLMNLSGQDLAIRTNKKDVFTLAPGKSRLADPGAKSLLRTEVGVREASGWKKTGSSLLPLPDNYRTVVFFLKSNSDFFKDVDGRVLDAVQTVVLREALPAPSAPTSH